MKLLLLDTSTVQAAVGVGVEQTVCAERRRTVTTHSEALLGMIDEVLRRAAPIWLVGGGVARYPELMVPGAQLVDADAGPHAAELLRLGGERLERGEHDPLASASPSYVRPSEAELAKAGKRQ